MRQSCGNPDISPSACCRYALSPNKVLPHVCALSQIQMIPEMMPAFQLPCTSAEDVHAAALHCSRVSSSDRRDTRAQMVMHCAACPFMKRRMPCPACPALPCLPRFLPCPALPCPACPALPCPVLSQLALPCLYGAYLDSTCPVKAGLKGSTAFQVLCCHRHTYRTINSHIKWHLPV